MLFIPFRQIQIRPTAYVQQRVEKVMKAGTFCFFVYFGFLFENIFTLARCTAVPHIRRMKKTETEKKQQQHSQETHRETECAKCIVMHLMWCKM